MGVAARISEIFLYRESGKCIFIKNTNLTTTKNSGGLEGRGWGVARVSDFFLFFKRIQV